MNSIIEAMNHKVEKLATKVIIVYSNVGMGKSSLFRNAPHTMFFNHENRLGHIEGSFKELKLPALKPDGTSNIDKIREAIKLVGNDYNYINRISELIKNEDKDGLKKAKEVLKDKFDVYMGIVAGTIDYPKLIVVDNVDDIYTSISKEVCDELKLEYLGADDRNLSYGIAKQRLMDIIRQLINIGCNVVLLASVTPKTEAWNTAGVSIPFLGSGCYDKETEVLTSEGWIYFKDIEKYNKNTLKFYSINKETKEIELVGYNKYIEYNHKGKMYKYESNSVSELVTPNHKIYAKGYCNKGDFKLIEAQEFKAKTQARLSQGINSSKISYENKDYLRLLGFWYGDGYKTIEKDGKGYKAGFNIHKKRKIDFLVDLLEKNNIEYARYERDEGRNEFRIAKMVYKDLFPEENSHTKRVPKWIYDLDSESIEAFLEGFINADGNIDGTGHITLYSCNKELLGDFQRVLLLTGRSGHLRTREGRISEIKGRKVGGEIQYELSVFIKNKIHKIKPKHTSIIENFDDKVFCVELEKNNTLYIRRNGKCIWSGNSSYLAVSRKISGVFPIDEVNGVRSLITNNSSPKWFVKNSFDRHWEGYKLPNEIKLEFEEVNKWIKWFTDDEIKQWKEKIGLKVL